MPISFSVIVPVYNGQRYLRQTIESLLHQTWKDYEIIVINDGSTDNTRLIMEQYKDSIISVHKNNNGTASALNYGIKASKFDWIKWVSADDILKPDALEKIAARINNTRTIYYTHYDRITHDGYKTSTFTEPNLNEQPQKYRNTVLLDHFYGNGSTSVIHKDVFDEVGLFDETVGYQEDYEFWLRCAIRHSIPLTLLDINTLKYRVHDNQLTEVKKGRDALTKSHGIRARYLTPEYEGLLKAYKRDRPISHRLKQKIISLLVKT